ncbi:MAG: hypothetical protein BWY04_00519 [candidate division CPR1 bacterium ADurb.Bin160]|uniref:Uncharacterized protein n=1 Tax=candidate division CPR1 bacterium ADurb.Bin160 TaxID=1852826 RepID=A0A1V5ZP68_9BACT|nr:MAG: hypothetical protein BWY04_00519 [candidate division CPR1 bacterium ADurb.Bin160]
MPHSQRYFRIIDNFPIKYDFSKFLIFRAPLWNNINPGYGGIDYFSQTRDSLAYIEDHENILRLCRTDETRFRGARRIENLCLFSEDFTESVWEYDNGAFSELVSDVSPPNNKYSLVNKISDFNLLDGDNVYQTIYSGINIHNRKFIAGCWIKTNEENNEKLINLTLKKADGSVEAVSFERMAITNTWQYFQFPIFTGEIDSEGMNLCFSCDVDVENFVSEFYVTGVFCEEISGSSDETLLENDYLRAQNIFAHKFSFLKKSKEIIPYNILRGAYLEPESTNFITYSNDYERSVWNYSVYVTRENNKEYSPDGFFNAAKITETTDDGVHQLQHTFSIDDETSHLTVSCYIKGLERNYFLLELLDSTAYAIFDLKNSRVVKEVEGIGGIQYLNNGWYRLWFSISPIDGSKIFTLRILNNWLLESYVGEEGKGFYIWGSQLEKKYFPTSYIYTELTTAQREADSPIEYGLSDKLKKNFSFDYPSNFSFFNETSTIFENSYWESSSGYDWFDEENFVWKDSYTIDFNSKTNMCSFYDGQSWVEFAGFDFSTVIVENKNRLICLRDSNNRIAWGYFGNPGTEMILGSNIILNGTFDSDTDWEKDASWSIADNKANKTSSLFEEKISQDLFLEEKKLYKITYDILDSTSTDNLQIFVEGVPKCPRKWNFETYIDFHNSETDNEISFEIFGDSGFVGSVDNVTLKEVTSPSAAGCFVYKNREKTENGWVMDPFFNMNDTTYTFDIIDDKTLEGSIVFQYEPNYSNYHMIDDVYNNIISLLDDIILSVKKSGNISAIVGSDGNNFTYIYDYLKYDLKLYILFRWSANINKFQIVMRSKTLDETYSWAIDFPTFWENDLLDIWENVKRETVVLYESDMSDFDRVIRFIETLSVGNLISYPAYHKNLRIYKKWLNNLEFYYLLRKKYR